MRGCKNGIYNNNQTKDLAFTCLYQIAIPLLAVLESRGALLSPGYKFQYSSYCLDK